MELTRAIARVMDMDIEIRLGSWSNIVADLEQGEIDVVQGMFYSPGRDLKFDFTPPHTSNQYGGVVRRDTGHPPATREELAGRRIAVQAGDGVLDFLAQDGLDSQEDVLQMVNAGQADCALAARIVALNLIERHRTTGSSMCPDRGHTGRSRKTGRGPCRPDRSLDHRCDHARHERTRLVRPASRKISGNQNPFHVRIHGQCHCPSRGPG